MFIRKKTTIINVIFSIWGLELSNKKKLWKYTNKFCAKDNLLDILINLLISRNWVDNMRFKTAKYIDR
jgi:hypothetical protein